MAIDYLDKQLDALRDEANQEKRVFTARKDAIRNDRTLSEEGKKELIEALHAATRERITQLLNREMTLTTERLEQINRRLAGSTGGDPSAIIAFRDAQDRAEAITEPAKAATMMRRALATGDKSLAAALMRRALDSNWPDVFEQYATANPTAAEDVNDFNVLQSFLNAPGHVMQRALIYTV